MEKVALITGCSSGFGLLTAVEMRKAGFKVVATMRNLNKRGKLDSKLNELGLNIDILELDITKENSIDHCVKTVLDKYGTIDVLVNNAGISISGFTEDSTMKDYEEVFETNFFGPVRLMKKVIPQMRERRSGKIINVASASEINPHPGLAIYCASKAALRAFSEALNLEGVYDGFTVSTVSSGTYKTEIFSDNVRLAKDAENPKGPHYAISLKFRAGIQDFVKKMTKDPNDVAKAIVSIAKEEHPKALYKVGLDSKIYYFLKHLLPDRAIVWINKKIWYGE